RAVHLVGRLRPLAVAEEIPPQDELPAPPQLVRDAVSVHGKRPRPGLGGHHQHPPAARASRRARRSSRWGRAARRAAVRAAWWPAGRDRLSALPEGVKYIERLCSDVGLRRTPRLPRGGGIFPTNSRSSE